MNTTFPEPQKIEHVQDNLLIGCWLLGAGSAFTGRIWKLLRACLGGNPQDRKTCHGFREFTSNSFRLLATVPLVSMITRPFSSATTD